MSETAPDPSFVSLYLDDGYYDWLCTISAGWRRPEGPEGNRPFDPEAEREIQRFLFREARLIDDRAFEAWLALYAPHCIYWIPSTAEPGDPRREIAQEFHDRRRLEDRIARLESGFAYSQIPAARTRHVLTNVEIWQNPSGDAMARGNFLIEVLHKGRRRNLAGWAGYCLRPEGAAWRLAVKQINLIDADLGHENNSFVL